MNPWLFEALSRAESGRRRLVRSRVGRGLGRVMGAPAIRKPLFIVGTVRSGTTLLADCLGVHPQILNVGFELSSEWHEFTGMPIATPGVDSLCCGPLTAGDLDPCTKERARRQFAELASRRGGGRHTLFLNKNPHFWNKVPYLRELFPDARFVVLSRSLRSTVASTKKLWEKMFRDWSGRHHLPEAADECWWFGREEQMDDEVLASPRTFPGGDVPVLAEYWLRTYRRLERDLGDAPTLPVAYSDFVASPVAQLRRIQTFAGIAPNPLKLPVEILQGRDERWRETLDSREQQALQAFVDEQRETLDGLRLAQWDSSGAEVDAP